MPDIRIEREHTLGLSRAREVAFRWAEEAERKLDMACVYEEGKTADLVTFTRSGVNGELRVTHDRFELQARLGLLLGAFKDRIEAEIAKNLDALLQHGSGHATARHAATSAKKPAAKKAPAKAAAKARKA
jgi:putative polyhydroxyalkanoate system protein